MFNTAQKIPDAVLAVITQFILGIGLATSAAQPTVLSFQDRASETMGIFLLILVTAIVAHPIRESFGRKDLSESEYILAVLAPIVTRLDLGLMIWVNVNKALVWAEQMLYATIEEMECVALLILASRVWHNGDNRIHDPEFGLLGGEAAVMMYRLERDYNPRNAGGNLLAWMGHFTLWPFAVIFHFLLQLLAVVGFALFWNLAMLARLTGTTGLQTQVQQRATYFSFLFRRKGGHEHKLFMRREVAAVLDSNQQLVVRSKARDVRYRWAMLSSVDAILQHDHFRRLLSIAYPMRAPLVYQRTLQDPVAQDISGILNQEQILFRNCKDDALAGVGEEASRQIVIYRLLGWPKHSEYSKACLDSLTKFAESNMMAWKQTEKRIHAQHIVHAEFMSVRDILRKYLVQLIMLAWCDGLGECYQDATVSDVTGDLTTHFLKTRLGGIEMSVRLCNVKSSWNDDQQASEMIKSLTRPLKQCNCNLCILMNEQRRLPDKRYQIRPVVSEIADDLEEEGCQKARCIESVWKNAVSEWISEIFEPQLDLEDVL